ncbi:hypothetical protein [Streptomyces sp. TRM49041]|uniref:hypothetical protein n=1 Tax=Streptomyces sp. TRM49041 TaxID=2603216 RepID=UPI0011EF802B|nr:hypothetical protein [Streptomyces sp. TRM49041]
MSTVTPYSSPDGAEEEAARLGYWLRELPTEPVPAERISPASTFRLVRVDAKTIWTRITGLLPDQGELRHAAARRSHPR